MAIRKKDIYGKVKPREDLFTRKKSKAKPVLMAVLGVAMVALVVVGATKIPWSDILPSGDDEPAATQDGGAGDSGSGTSGGSETSGGDAQGGEGAGSGAGANNSDSGNAMGSGSAVLDMSKIPAYAGEPYVEINNNKPSFTEKELTKGNFVTFSKLDKIGRTGVATAVFGPETLSAGDGRSTAEKKPTGLINAKYDSIRGEYLYSCRQLISSQLTGQDGGEKNQMTATQYMTSVGLWNYSIIIEDYIKNSGNHVAYRVTPVFEGDNLLASGVQLEAYSIEDKGKGLSFNIYCYNVQPGITIDYATGASS